jgi:hypothetical protein
MFMAGSICNHAWMFMIGCLRLDVKLGNSDGRTVGCSGLCICNHDGSL